MSNLNMFSQQLCEDVHILRVQITYSYLYQVTVCYQTVFIMIFSSLLILNIIFTNKYFFNFVLKCRKDTSEAMHSCYYKNVQHTK